MTVYEEADANGDGKRNFTMRQLADAANKLPTRTYYAQLRRIVCSTLRLIVNAGLPRGFDIADLASEAELNFLAKDSFAYVVRAWPGEWTKKAAYICIDKLERDSKEAAFIRSIGIDPVDQVRVILKNLAADEMNCRFERHFGEQADSYQRVYEKLAMLVPGLTDSIESKRAAAHQAREVATAELEAFIRDNAVAGIAQADPVFVQKQQQTLDEVKLSTVRHHEDTVALLDNLRMMTQDLLSSIVEVKDALEIDPALVVLRAAAMDGRLELDLPVEERSVSAMAECQLLCRGIEAALNQQDGSWDSARVQSLATVVLLRREVKWSMAAPAIGIDPANRSRQRAVSRYRDEIQTAASASSFADQEMLDFLAKMLP